MVLVVFLWFRASFQRLRHQARRAGSALSPREVHSATEPAAKALARRMAALGILSLFASCGPAIAEGASATHYLEAEVASVVGGTFAAPPTRLTSLSAPKIWMKAALPHVARRSSKRDPTIITTWYRFHPAPEPSQEDVYLYVPRWQVTGKLAIYADGQLIFAPRSGPQWMAFNLPIWVKLADAGAKRPADVIVVISSLKSSGGGISSVWIGQQSALEVRHAVRYWLQIKITEIISVADAIFGCVALIIWFWWRRERAFLLLAAAASFNIVWEIQFRTGDAALPIAEPWFGWVTICALEWWILCAYLFSLQIIGVRSPWLTRLLLAFTALFTIVTLPVSPPGLSLVSATLSPLLDVITLGCVAFMTVSLWVAYARKRSHEGLIVCLYNTVWPLAGFHDVLLQTYKISIEALCFAPVVFSFVLIAMIYLMARRYILVMRAADEHAVELENRVRAREAELNVSHRLLRDIERKQAVATERQRMMRDMHDGVGSSLMGALTAIERGRLGQGDVAQMLRECVDELKLTIDSLDTVDPDLPLLLATIRYRLGARFEEGGVSIQWRVADTPPLPWLDAERALHLLRIVQEIFSNIIKHADASRVTVTTEVRPGSIILSIEDDGKGFDVEQPPQIGRRGLRNLRDRAAAIGATVGWTSGDAGTRVELNLPFVTPISKLA